MLFLLLFTIAVILCLHFLPKMQSDPTKSVALDPQNFKKFRLSKKTTVSHDTFIFRFELSHPEQKLGLPIGNHIVIRAPTRDASGKEEMVERPYSPISSDEDKGFVDFLIQVYLPNEAFPQGGRLTQYLYNLNIGDSVEMRGPEGKFTYLGNGNFETNEVGKGIVSRHVDAFAMIAGGSGITPMLQIIRAIERDPQDPTKCFLIVANETENDIVFHDELDTLQKSDKRFHIWYTLRKEIPSPWEYSTGFVTEEMVRDHLPVPESFGSSKIPQNKGITSAFGILCGPPATIEFKATLSLEKAGYSTSDIFSF